MAKINYDEMFDPDFTGHNAPHSDKTSMREHFSKNICKKLGLTPEQSAQLAGTMAEFHYQMYNTRTITKDNLFEHNAQISDSFKEAFTAGEKIVEEHLDKKNAEKEAKRQAILGNALPEHMERLRDMKLYPEKYPPKNMTKNEKDYLKAYEKYEKECAKIDKKYEKKDAAMVVLGQQLQKMAANRGKIAKTVENMYDDLRSGKVQQFTGENFGKLIKDTELKVFEQDSAAGKDKGMINEVYRVEVGMDDLFIKQGERKIKEGEMVGNKGVLKGQNLFQLDGLGIVDLLNMSPEEVKKQTNESAFRDQGAQRAGKVIGLEGMVVQSSLETDAGAGYVSAMAAAKGRQGAKVFGATSKEEYENMKARIDAYHKNCTANRIKPDEYYPAGVIDLNNPSLQVETLKMGILDYVCGQDDRHGNNFFVEEKQDGTYKLTGIDNDGAFTSKHDPNIHVESAVPFVTPELKTLVKNMKPAEVTNALKGLVDRGENGKEVLARVQERIEKLKDHVDKVPVYEQNQLNEKTAAKIYEASNNPMRQIHNVRGNFNPERLTEKENELDAKIADKKITIGANRTPRKAPEKAPEPAKPERQFTIGKRGM